MTIGINSDRCAQVVAQEELIRQKGEDKKLASTVGRVAHRIFQVLKWIAEGALILVCSTLILNHWYSNASTLNTLCVSLVVGALFGLIEYTSQDLVGYFNNKHLQQKVLL